MLSSNVWPHARLVNTPMGRLRRCISFALFFRRWSASRYLRFEGRGNMTKVRDVWHGHLRMGYRLFSVVRRAWVRLSFSLCMRRAISFLSSSLRMVGVEGKMGGNVVCLWVRAPRRGGTDRCEGWRPGSLESAGGNSRDIQVRGDRTGAGSTCYFFGLLGSL